MSDYKVTHPWINFTLDLRRLSLKVWLLLGEAHSKCDHISNSPVKPAYAKQMHMLYLIKGALATTAIEGNTLYELLKTEEELERFMRGEKELPASQEYQEREVRNIIGCANWLQEALVRKQSLTLNVETIRKLNHDVLVGTPDADEEGTVPGEFRTHSVVVGQIYRGAPAQDCEQLVERLCEWINEPWLADSQEPELAIPEALIKAVVAHLYLAWIHPFGNGNGRTARLVEQLLLLSAGVPVPSAQLLGNYYNLTRSQYYKELDRSSKADDPLPFVEYAVNGFVEEIGQQVDAIHEQHLQLAWHDYVDEVLTDTSVSAGRAQRWKLLMKQLPDEAIDRSEIRYLTPTIAEAYAGSTDKTVSRDLSELAKLCLIDIDGHKVRARYENILMLRPIRKT